MVIDSGSLVFTITFRDEVWRSDDNGVTWTEVVALDSAPFIGRSDFGFVSHANQLFIMGGLTATSTGEIKVLHDIWKSSDNGATWTEVVGSNPPWSARHGLGTVSYNGRLFVVGGFSGLPPNPNPQADIYKSENNGELWSQVSVSSTWAARAHFGLVVHNESLFIMGGTSGAKLFNDVWEFKQDGELSNVFEGSSE